MKEPCQGCAPPYSYRNHMPLSSQTKMFAEKVKEAAISGNLDAPEGGFDAIMQAVICKVCSANTSFANYLNVATYFTISVERCIHQDMWERNCLLILQDNISAHFSKLMFALWKFFILVRSFQIEKI